MKRILLLNLVVALSFCLKVSAQTTTLAAWTFPTSFPSPNTPTSFTANLGAQTGATIYANGTNGSSAWLQASELNMFGGTTTNDPNTTPANTFALALLNQSANSKAIVLAFSLTGYKDPILTYAAQRTSTGFSTQTWAWSTDGTTFTDFPTSLTIPTAFGTIVQTVDFSSVNALDGAASVYLRLTVTGATSASGNNRLDNIVVNATAASFPNFTASYPLTQNISATGFDGVVNLDRGATVYVTIQDDAVADPTSAQVKAGQDALGNALAANLKMQITVPSGSADVSFSMTGLTSASNYNVYFVAENTDGIMPTPSKVHITTLDASDANPPVTSSGYPVVNAITYNSFAIRSKIDEPGNTYFVILADNAAAPTSAQIKAHTDASGAAVSLSGTILINAANTEYASIVSSISPSTAYDVYIVSEDNIPNLQTTPVKIDVSTPAAPLIFSEDFNTCNGNVSSFSQVSVTGPQIWDCSTFGNNTTNGIQINAGTSTGSTINEDWLISPLLTFGPGAFFSFDNKKEFSGADITVKISLDYNGSDPTMGTWYDLTFIKSTGTFVSSGNIDLSSYSGLKAYIGIVYTSGSAINTGARWTIDNFVATNATGSYLSTSTTKLRSFGYAAFPAASSPLSFTVQAMNTGAALTATAPTNFEISKDGTTFASSLSYTSTEASSLQTIYVRFKPTAAGIGFQLGSVILTSASVTKGIAVSATEGIDPRASTFDVTTYNMEFFGTDVKDASGVEFGPTNDVLQVANVSTVLQTLGSDIYGVEEIADDAAFAQLVANLPGYAGIVSPRWSYSFQPADPFFPPQKVGFIYNASTVQILSSRPMFAKLYDDIQAGNVTLPAYPGGTSTSFWSSGRLPFMIKANVTINGVTKKITLIDIHSKSGSASADYDRRQYDVKVLYDSLAANYPTDNIILVGDYNDDVDTSIYTGHDSSYKGFVDDVTNYKTLTYDLSVAGSFSFPSSSSFLDHIIISNELVSSYVDQSIFIEDPNSYIASYSSTTSDHLPVTARFTLTKDNQQITFNPLPDKSAGDASFTLTATTTSGLPITYTSSNTTVATISGNILTIVGAGSTTITASQAGNASFNPASDASQTQFVNVGTQTITFPALSGKVVGDAAFTLTGSSSSGLTLTYVSSNTAVATISGSTVTIVSPGTTTITASQAGNASFGAATSVDQPFIVGFGTQVITFGPITPKAFGSAPFSLTATSNAGLPITFNSSNTAVATINGSTVTIVGIGSTDITASALGDSRYNAAVNVVQTLTVTAIGQTITFGALPDRTLGDAPFALTATSSAGLTVAYATTSDKISIVGSQVSMSKAGRVTITASQNGNANVAPALPIDQSFCIKPQKPIVTSTNLNSESPTLTANTSIGVQWYLNGTAISGATNATFNVTTPGVYKVQSKVDDCASAFSSDVPIIVTGDLLPVQKLVAYPNPAFDVIDISGITGQLQSSQVVDMIGKTNSITLVKNGDIYRAYIDNLSPGIYILRVQETSTTHQIKFIKK